MNPRRDKSPSTSSHVLVRPARISRPDLSEAIDLIRGTRHLLAAMALLLVLTGFAGPALASPSSDVSAAQGALDLAVRQYGEGLARLTALQTSMQEQAAELDSLVAERSSLQESLGERAAYLYRSGPFAFVQVLLSSNTLNDFIARWDALVRFSREEAATIQKLQATEERLRAAGARLLKDQAAASHDLRALEDAKAQARKTLAASQAAYAAYQKQITEREALAARRLEAAAAAAAVEAARTQTPQPVVQSSAPRSAGAPVPWKTAVASCYGSGSYGVHLASGYTIGPDSMIVAHKTLPFGTLVEFSFRGRTAVATVADRGPYVSGRTWDLGPGVARVLRFAGVETVSYRVLGR